MPSLRPSQITLQSRSDGGPFVEFLLFDGEGIPTDDVLHADSCEVYFSDITADFEKPEAVETWHSDPVCYSLGDMHLPNSSARGKCELWSS